MPKKTQEQLRKIQERLDNAQPHFDQIQTETQASEQKWDNEIALLQRRVAEKFEQVDIGGGDSLAIRTCLSDEESERFSLLLATSEKKDSPLEDRATATYELLALVTANPLLTADWFRDNRANYATMDIMSVLVGFIETKAKQQNVRVQRVKDIRSFRPES